MTDRQKVGKLHAELQSIENTLGRTLFGKTHDNQPLWGEHTAETLSLEAGYRLIRYEDAIVKLLRIALKTMDLRHRSIEGSLEESGIRLPVELIQKALL